MSTKTGKTTLEIEVTYLQCDFCPANLHPPALPISATHFGELCNLEHTLRKAINKLEDPANNPGWDRQFVFADPTQPKYSAAGGRTLHSCPACTERVNRAQQGALEMLVKRSVLNPAAADYGVAEALPSSTPPKARPAEFWNKYESEGV